MLGAKKRVGRRSKHVSKGTTSCWQATTQARAAKKGRCGLRATDVGSLSCYRKLMTLQGLCDLTIVVRRCHNQACSRYQYAYRPEEEGRWALPHGECGLDVIALVGGCAIGSTEV